MAIITRLFSLLLLAFPLLTIAGEASTVTSLTPPGYLLKLVLSLVVVLLLVVGLAWSVRKLGGGGLINRTNEQLKLTAVLSVGTRERIVLVQAGDEHILLGVTAGDIKKLHVLTAHQADFQATLATELVADKAES